MRICLVLLLRHRLLQPPRVHRKPKRSPSNVFLLLFQLASRPHPEQQAEEDEEEGERVR